MSEAMRNAPETLVAGLRELGFTITLAGVDRVRIAPTSRLNKAARRWLETHRSELIAELQAERVESTGEVLELARYRFPNREDLPAPPPVPGRDPLAQHDTDKARFFRGDWSQAWPQDFNPGGAA